MRAFELKTASSIVATSGLSWYVGRRTVSSDYFRTQRLLSSEVGIREKPLSMMGTAPGRIRYSNWTLASGIMVADSSFRLTDGKTEISQTTGNVEMVPRNVIPSLSLFS